MQENKEVTPLQFLAETSREKIKTPRQSPRFNIEPSNAIVRTRMSLPFVEMRAKERRDQGNLLMDRTFTLENGSIPGRGRRNSIIFPVNPVNDADQQLSQLLHMWKFKRNQTERTNDLNESIFNTLTMVEKFHAQGVYQFYDVNRQGELGLSNSLLTILEAMYKCPAVKSYFIDKLEMFGHFCLVNYLVRDYKFLHEEAEIILKMIKNHTGLIESILTKLGQQQIEAINEFAFVPFVKDLAANCTAQEIFKSGLLKERDIPAFYQRLGMRKFIGLDNEVARVKMVELIVHPEVIHLIYAPIAVPTKSVITKESLAPLKHVVEILEANKNNLDMFEDDDLETKINLALTPMGKIKERVQLMLEDLIIRLAQNCSHLEQVHYRDLLSRLFPPIQVGRRRNWTKAFEVLQEVWGKQISR